MTTAEKKLARRRFSVLEACRKRGIARSQFYEYKRRFQTHGLEGLVDLLPIPHSHPQSTPAEVVEKILETSLTHPIWGCNRLSNQLQLKGISVSGVTIQKILEKNGLGSKYERLLKLEEKALAQEIES